MDPTFVTNVQAAREAGVLIGGYHFAHPEQNTALQEAAYFVSLLQANQTDLLPVLDLESPTDPSSSTLTGTEIAQWVRDFVNYVKSAMNCGVMLYTGPWYINEFEINGLSDLPLWIARYSDIPPADCGGWTQWTAWQYTDSGDIAGVGNCDVSVAVSLEALKNGEVNPPNPNIIPVCGIATITGDNVNLRDGSSLQANVIRQLHHGEAYRVFMEENGWLNLGGKQWVYYDASYIQYQHYAATIIGDNVNLRDGPSLQANIIRQLHHGEAYQVFAEENGWLNLGGNQWIYYDASYIQFAGE